MLPDTDTCTVYHGTNLFAAKIIQCNGIWLNAQRQLTDFGRGFYVTLNLYQARSWAQIRAAHPQISPEVLERLNISKAQYFDHPDTKIPAYLVYELNLKQLHQLKGKIFPLPHDPEWLQYRRSWEIFVQECRTGKKHDYEYVYGPVGGSHPTNPNQIKVSSNKEQLSLNSMNAIRCLSKLKVVTIKPEEKYTKKSLIKQIFNHVRSLKNTNHSDNVFLLEIRDKLMTIGNLTSQQANKLIQKSSIASNFDPIIMHEPAAYWAFSILYGTHKLWYKDYEAYMRKEN